MPKRHLSPGVSSLNNWKGDFVGAERALACLLLTPKARKQGSPLASKHVALATCLVQSKTTIDLFPLVTPKGIWEEDFLGAGTDVTCF